MRSFIKELVEFIKEGPWVFNVGFGCFLLWLLVAGIAGLFGVESDLFWNIWTYSFGIITIPMALIAWIKEMSSDTDDAIGRFREITPDDADAIGRFRND